MINVMALELQPHEVLPASHPTELPSVTYRPLLEAAASYWTHALTLPSNPQVQEAVTSGIQTKLGELLDLSDPSYDGTRQITFGVREDPGTDIPTRAAAAILNELSIRREQGERFTAKSLKPPHYTHVVVNPEARTVVVRKEEITRDTEGNVVTYNPLEQTIFSMDAGSALSE